METLSRSSGSCILQLLELRYLINLYLLAILFICVRERESMKSRPFSLREKKKTFNRR